MSIPQRIVQQTMARYAERTPARQRSEGLIRQGRYLEADTPDRVAKFLARRQLGPGDGREVVARAASGLPAVRESLAEGRTPSALERMIGTNDLIGVAFLEAGLRVARTVGRIWVGVVNGRAAGYGTGFLISPRLLLTNHHVLGDPGTARRSQVEFDYQIGLSGALAASTTFGLDPDTFFAADEHLDYAVVAVREAGTAGRPLAGFGWNPLIEEEGKAIISQWLNVIQHPNGEPKQLGLRENQLVDVLDDFLHYKTDTAPGSSGSPVFNDRWEVVGLHHSGVWATDEAGHILAVDGRRWTEDMGEHRVRWVSNEGVRISRVVAHLRTRATTPAARRLFEEVFSTPPDGLAGPVENKPEAGPVVGDTRVTVGADGTATWTIPLTVSVRLGGVPAVAPAVPPPPVPPVPPPPPAAGRGAGADSRAATVEAARREFAGRGGVLGVRAGFVFEGGWITDRPAIVVTVRGPGAFGDSPLPGTFRGLPVQTTGPSVEDLVAQVRGADAAQEAFSAPAVTRSEITYRPPAGAELKKVTGRMRVTAHVSPDAGWPRLKEFLGKTRKSMTIGMYDFGAPHVVEALAAGCDKPGFRKLTLVMQRGESVGEGTKADDLTDDEVVEKLREALGDKFENAWVKIGRVNGWVSSSYHIKVAVQDQKAFWLSSGNLQSSNQPKADPLAEDPPRRTWLDRYNREWHAVVEHPDLAKAFEAFLLHDFRNNTTGGEEVAALPDLLIPASVLVPPAAERVAGFRYFQPFDRDREFTVTPLLTPDNYHEHVLDLVTRATETLDIQNQTFNAPGEGHDKLAELVDAVLARRRAGVRVRVIFRSLFPAKTRQALEALQEYGFPTEVVRVQPNCHTKGIVADRKRVLLGSQNWSNDGVSVNRDASLLFDDAELAGYFADIFEHDWEVLARQTIGDELEPVEVAAASDPTPPGMVRLSWKDYMEMM